MNEEAETVSEDDGAVSEHGGSSRQTSEGGSPLWTAGVRMPAGGRLTSDLEADVCVIGAGIAGVTTAYLLAREGRSVVLLDDGKVGGGETGRTTAHLASAIDDRFVELERLHGEEGSRLAAHSHATAVDQIERHVTEERIACGFRRLDGYLFQPPGESSDLLKRELEAAHRAGLTDVKLARRAPFKAFNTGPSLRFPRQGQFHPLRYLAGLTRAFLRRGGKLYTRQHVERIEGGERDGERARIVTSRGRSVRASAVVVATNSPVSTLVAIHTKQAPYRTYAIAARVPKGMVRRALYWDTGDPYHYVRLQDVPRESWRATDTDADVKGSGSTGEEGSEAKGRTRVRASEEFLIVGGEDHKTGQADDADDRYARLEAWARERIPEMKEVEYRWSGQVMEPVDGVAFIGRSPGDVKNVFLATGDSGMGMTHGTIAGILISDLIQGRQNAWATLYDPSRITLRAAPEFTRENVNVAVQYGEWLTADDVESVGEIARGSGAVMRRGLTKIAVYRDDHGAVHELSAVCTHLGCIVAWNSEEKSWDCPCHGSRYDPFGKVLNGPAVMPLGPVEAEG